MTELSDSWDLANPVRIVAARGALNRLPHYLEGARRILLVTSAGFRARGGVDRVLALLEHFEVHTLDDISPNPGLAEMSAQIDRFSPMEIEGLVAIGGGSVIDTAKILAALIGRRDISLRGHLFEAQPLPTSRALRLIAVPTTAGTGSEVTPFATVWDTDAKKKYSASGDALFPDVALLDPELTLSMPEDVTLSTGLDAITQALEATWSRRANPVSTALAVRALGSGLRTLPALLEQPDDLALREAMLEVSLLAGLAISRTRTALCHSISYPITARFGLPHGYACALTLPEVFAFNRDAAPEHFEDLARAIGFESADAFHQRLLALLDSIQFGMRVRRFIGDGSSLEALAPEMLTPGRADNNLRRASVEDVVAIIRKACRARGL